MSQHVRSLGVIAVAFVVAMAAAGGTAVAGTKLEFRLSNQFPASHHISKGIILFANKVKEYSKGSIEVKDLDSAQLDKDTEIVEALQDGLIETGLVPVNKWSGMIPAADVFEMPVSCSRTSPRLKSSSTPGRGISWTRSSRSAR